MFILGFVQWLASAVLPLLVIFTVVITVPELGHFLGARLFGVKVDRFSIGFGKTLLSRTDKSGVEWRLAALPFGGYVKFSGDANTNGVPDADDLAELKAEIIEAEGPGAERRYYHFKPVWQRALIAAAGPVSNFLLAIFIFGSLTWALGEDVIAARIGTVTPNSPAAHAGFQPGDEIVKADGHSIDSVQGLAQYVFIRGGEPITFEVRRAGQTVTLKAEPATVSITENGQEQGHKGQLGLGPDLNGRYRHVSYGPLEAYRQGAKTTWSILSDTTHYLGRIFRGRESGDQISGPIGMLKASGDTTKAAAAIQGPLWLKAANVALHDIELVALISIGIGFLNLLPIPVLDGGHLLFYAYEAVARKPLGARVQELGLQVGLALLVCLMLFAGWNDLHRQGLFKILGGLFS